MLLFPFEKAIQSLDEVLKEPKNAFLRDATIQRFEYTFELAIRVLQRYFQEKSTEIVNVDALTYNELCRYAAEAELIRNPSVWFEFRMARSITSHAYDERKAESVYVAAQQFLPEAKALLEQLKQRV